MFRKTLISIKLDIFKYLSKKPKGQLKGTCYCKIAVPKNMPKEVKEDIQKRLNDIIDIIRIYL